MKKVKLILSTVLILFCTAAYAQTIDEIISKHIDAIGGKEKISQVKSIYAECSIDVMGNQAPVVEYLVNGKGFKSETEFNGMKIINCFTEKSGWMINPMMGGASAETMPDVLYHGGKDQIYVGGALANYAALGGKAELLGKEGDQFKIKISTGSSETFYFIDPNTYLLVKTQNKGEMMGQAVDITTTYSDYKKTDIGLVLSHAKNVDMGQFVLTYTTSKVEINKEIDSKIFEMPK